MTDMLGDAVDWLAEQRTSRMARTAFYSRGGRSVELLVTPGSTTYTLADEAGAGIEVQATDFILTAADLVLDGEPVEPETGDRIRLDVGGAIAVYEVLDLVGGGHFRPADPMGVTLRVHAKRVDEETIF